MNPVALTIGEPAGVGLELALSAWEKLQDKYTFFLIADRRQISHSASDIPVYEISSPDEAKAAISRGLPLLHFEFPRIVDPGQAALENANAVVQVIKLAVELVQAGKASAICTNPVNKFILRSGTDFSFPGQTELLQCLCGTGQAVMLLASPMLKVVPLTTHLPLKGAASQVTVERIAATAKTLHRALQQDFAIEHPRISICGLNPHAGEFGEFGQEEQTTIGPAADKLRAEGLDISGPHPADSLFHAEARRTYDAALCMYHDQALIPLKALDFWGSVNVTIGLPIIRTSPDHGTAFEIAGKGVARADSLIRALVLATEIAHNRNSL